jgi:hypothetical protein
MANFIQNSIIAQNGIGQSRRRINQMCTGGKCELLLNPLNQYVVPSMLSREDHVALLNVHSMADGDGKAAWSSSSSSPLIVSC